RDHRCVRARVREGGGPARARAIPRRPPRVHRARGGGYRPVHRGHERFHRTRARPREELRGDRVTAMRLGILIPTRGVVMQSARRPPVEECWTMARLADEAGYDAVWVGDSVVAQPRLEPITTLRHMAGTAPSSGAG